MLQNGMVRYATTNAPYSFVTVGKTDKKLILKVKKLTGIFNSILLHIQLYSCFGRENFKKYSMDFPV